MRYTVTATVTRVQSNGYTGVRTVPTFYLDPEVQEITCHEDAYAVARDILEPFVRLEEHVMIVAVPIEAKVST